MTDQACVFEELGVGRRHGFAYSSVAGNEAFRKADDPCPLDSGLIDGLPGERIDSAGVAGNLILASAIRNGFTTVPSKTELLP